MKYTVIGTIKDISEKKTLKNGAIILHYIIQHEDINGFKTDFNINYYCKQDKEKFMDNFILYNEVGNTVSCEFFISSSEYEGKVFNSLNHWKTIQIPNE